MKIYLITPAPTGSHKGNRITALRWASILRSLDHRVWVAEHYTGQRCDVLIALHARRSAESIARFRVEHPTGPLVVALTGTDLYGDIHTSPEAQRSLALASRLVVLQPLGVQELPAEFRARARVIYQSVPAPRFRVRAAEDNFDVCVMGHLRPVKDPFRTALAARLLPDSSHVRILHLGAALSDDMAEQARAEESANPRYRWLGDQPRGKALRLLARCRLLSLTSRLEGGANVISEAVVVSVPVISSHIAGSVGLLGEDYPGYFPVGDMQALAGLLRRAETDQEFLAELQRRCQALRPLFEPAEEARRWRELLAELTAEG
jgi:putative glycosyltransferase (TIGR04348 family)